MNKRPINPTDKLRAEIGEGNVDGKNTEERILKALAFYGIENNKVTLWGDGSHYVSSFGVKIWLMPAFISY